MSDILSGEIPLVPSRTRRYLLDLAAAALAVLALALAAAGTGPSRGAALACTLAAGIALFRGRRPGTPGCLRLDPLAGLRALSASPMRIVFFAAQRHVVVWHDANDAATYRRLAVLARWQPRGQSR